MNAPRTIRVRFAPSPTGHLHVGGARTALFNWLYARKTGGVFVLRIEDTDAERSTRESYEAILDAMTWLGLDWDEGPERGGPHEPYVQSARRVIYQAEVERLLGSGRAYRCFCTPEELDELRREAADEGRAFRYDGRCRRLPDDEVAARVARGVPHVVRFRMEPGETVFHDVVRGEFRFDNADLDDFVVRKSDGNPTYNFACVVDDARMEITHVIRGDDHISNTPRQVQLYRALGYRVPRFVHLPMILGPDRARLSKRHGATSVQEFRRMGFLPDAMINYLALLGWSLDGKTEFFTRKSLVEKFSLKRVSKNPAAFDMDKLRHINAEHFKRLDATARVRMVAQRLVEEGILPPTFDPDTEPADGGAGADASGATGVTDAVVCDEALADPRVRAALPRVGFIVSALGNRLSGLQDVDRMMRYFFRDDYERDPEAWEKHLSDPAAADRLDALAAELEALDDFGHNAIEAAVRGLAERMGVRAGDLIHPCRVAITGRSVSPDIFTVIQLVGRHKSVERLREVADAVRRGERPGADGPQGAPAAGRA